MKAYMRFTVNFLIYLNWFSFIIFCIAFATPILSLYISVKILHFFGYSAGVDLSLQPNCDISFANRFFYLAQGYITIFAPLLFLHIFWNVLLI